MHVDVDTGVGLEFIQRIVQRLWELIVTSVGHAESRHHADGVFVTGFNHAFRVHKQLTGAHRDLTQLHIPVAGEFMPADLYRTAHQVWFIRWFACSFHTLAPTPFHRHPAEHTGLGRTNGVGANGLTIFRRRRMPQIGNHIYATQVDGCGLRIFFFVDPVFIDRQIHQFMDVFVVPGLAESGQVLTSVAIKI